MLDPKRDLKGATPVKLAKALLRLDQSSRQTGEGHYQRSGHGRRVFLPTILATVFRI